MKAKYYNPKSAFCNLFCGFRKYCSNAVCPIVKYEKKHDEDTE